MQLKSIHVGEFLKAEGPLSFLHHNHLKQATITYVQAREGAIVDWVFLFNLQSERKQMSRIYWGEPGDVS